LYFDTAPNAKCTLAGAVGTTYLAEPLFQDNEEWPPRLAVNTQTEQQVPMLEMHETIFYSNYYSNPGILSPLLYITTAELPSAGRSKLETLVTEIRRLTTIKHPNLQEVYAVKLTSTQSKQSALAFTSVSSRAGSELIYDDRRHLSSGGPTGAYMRLCILVECSPQLILEDLLAQCEFLRKDRAIVSVSGEQMCSELMSIIERVIYARPSKHYLSCITSN
jgi:hypothetical protein